MSDIKNKFTVLALLDNVSNLYWTPCMILINNLLYLWYKWAKTGKRMKPIQIYWYHPITWDRVRLPTYCLPQLKLQLGHYVKSEQEHKWLKVDLESTHRDRSNTNVCKTWSRHLENKLNTWRSSWQYGRWKMRKFLMSEKNTTQISYSIK